ncbi:NSFL1 cofactor p47 [Thelohanellus kitauei]|uniref:NSFL1 cofactor p47 n=1 Tax=Thelohanellus kitauei TaxID=669202 RepID=A0A0C2JV18_THEKT|nr:NSFL1 cofactor p47 [Thelohanellus kitauei]
MADREDDLRRSIIREFQDITNLNEKESEFYLNAAEFDLIEALEIFYSSSGRNGSTTGPPNVPKSGTARNPPPSSAAKPKIVTMEDIIDVSDSQDSDGTEKFFVGGGSQNSGGHTQVVGDTRQPYDIEKIFERARKSGANIAANINTRSTQNSHGDRSLQPGNVPASDTDPSEVTVIDIYQNGFLLDGERFFPLNDPKTREYLEHIVQGYVPIELHKQFKTKSQKPLISLNNKAEEFYEPPKPDVTFSTNFKVLGSADLINASQANIIPLGPGETRRVTPIVAVTSRPTSKIVYRFIDGSRRNVVINPDVHTVRDLYSHIRSETSDHNFVLVNGYPSQIIPENDTLIEKAGLLDSIIFMRTV